MSQAWMIPPPWPGRMDAARRLNVAPIMAQMLHNRAILETGTEIDQAREYLSPAFKNIHHPERIHGTLAAAQLLARKVREGKSIVIYGDYDVDGITGTAILWHLLRLAGTNVSYYIPNRLEEGYGVNNEAIKQIHANGADTIVTVDCGITSVSQAQLARELGLTFIITDHHAPASSLPAADAIVHPALGDDCVNPNLCGAGVAYKLAWALACELTGNVKVRPEFRAFLLDATALVALGTIADVVPIRDENRILARFGLQGIPESKLHGLVALLESARLTHKKLDADHVGFWLAPRLNAAGRMGFAHLAAELLTHADAARAKEIALYLEEHNRKRQSTERQIFEQACEMIEQEQLAGDAHRAIVLAREDWHAGVIGIVASRLVDRYHRPAILISLDNGMGQGSGRSIPHFPLNEALAACAEHLVAYGGHAMAAGLRIQHEAIPAFREAFVHRANQCLTGQDLQKKLRLDAEVTLAELSEPVVRDMGRLAPFGVGNPKPKFATAMLALADEPRVIGKKGEHLSFSLTDGRIRRRVIAFKKADQLNHLLTHRRCAVAFEPILNTFNGRTSVELQVLDIHYPDTIHANG